MWMETERFWHFFYLRLTELYDLIDVVLLLHTRTEFQSNSCVITDLRDVPIQGKSQHVSLLFLTAKEPIFQRVNFYNGCKKYEPSIGGDKSTKNVSQVLNNGGSRTKLWWAQYCFGFLVNLF